MDKFVVAQVVSESLTRREVLDRMGLEHSMRNFRELGMVIERNQIDTRHLQRIKASEYVRQLRLTNSEVVV